MVKRKITNWSEYNTALKNRGSITLWVSEDAIQKWLSTEHTCKKGRPCIYSDEAILCALLLRIFYHLPLRALQGFLISIFSLMKINLPVPSYTQISRRSAKMGKKLQKLLQKGTPSTLVIDSTGLKVYGEGEWKVKQHGSSKRRTWKKLHIGIDPETMEIRIAELTDNGIGSGDAQVGTKMLKKLQGKVKKVVGDGAYDSIEFRKAVHEKGGQAIVPPPRDGVVNLEEDHPAVIARNYAIKEITGFGGDEIARKLWKKCIGYHERSLVETTMYRIKQITGGQLRSRTWENQYSESLVKCIIINKITELGMPKGYWEEVESKVA